MRIIPWLACLAAACSSRGRSLDRFDHAIELAGLGCPGRQLDGTRWTCRPVVGNDPYCPCKADLELVGSKDGRDLVAVSYSVQHFTHAEAISADRHLIEWFPAKDLESIFDRPAGVDQNADIQRVHGTYIHGNRVLDLEWSREAYRDVDGTVKSQGLESYVVTIRPREDIDHAYIKTSDDPTIVSRQKCLDE